MLICCAFHIVLYWNPNTKTTGRPGNWTWLLPTDCVSATDHFLQTLLVYCVSYIHTMYYLAVGNYLIDIPERVKCKLGVITRRCLYGSAPQYLAACCILVSTTASRQHFRCAASHQLVIPSHRLTTYGRRAFSVTGAMFWNSLPRHPRERRDPSHTDAVFWRLLKTFLFSQY